MDNITKLHGKIEYNENRVHSERIILTNNCNFNCSYCLQLSRKPDILSEENTIKRISLLELRLSKLDSAKINLFGGEPMINWNSFFKFTEKFKNNEKVSLSTITNGSLLNEDRIKYLSEIKNFGLELSFDGNKECNQWRTIDEEQTFSLLLNKLELLNKYNAKYLIRSSIGKFNLPFLNDSLRLFKSIGVKRVYIQCACYPDNQKLDNEDIQFLISIVDKFKDKDFNVIIFNNDISITNDFKNEIFNYTHQEQRYITQPNGITYSYIEGKPLGIPDFKMYELEYDEDLSYTNIFDMINLNTLEYKKV